MAAVDGRMDMVLLACTFQYAVSQNHVLAWSGDDVGQYSCHVNSYLARIDDEACIDRVCGFISLRQTFLAVEPGCENLL